MVYCIVAKDLYRVTKVEFYGVAEVLCRYCLVRIEFYGVAGIVCMDLYVAAAVVAMDLYCAAGIVLRYLNGVACTVSIHLHNVACILVMNCNAVPIAVHIDLLCLCSKYPYSCMVLFALTCSGEVCMKLYSSCYVVNIYGVPLVVATHLMV